MDWLRLYIPWPIHVHSIQITWFFTIILLMRGLSSSIINSDSTVGSSSTCIFTQVSSQNNKRVSVSKMERSEWHCCCHSSLCTKNFTQEFLTSTHTLVLHPTLVEFMRIHGFGSRIIAEGIIFGDHDRFAAMTMKIDMFGQMSNTRYVGPSFTFVPMK